MGICGNIGTKFVTTYLELYFLFALLGLYMYVQFGCFFALGKQGANWRVTGLSEVVKGDLGTFLFCLYKIYLFITTGGMTDG